MGKQESTFAAGSVQHGPLMAQIKISMKPQPFAAWPDAQWSALPEGVAMAYRPPRGKKVVAMLERGASDALVCRYCRSKDGTEVAWCEHLSAAVHGRRDAGALAPGRWVVPVVPGEGIFCSVELAEVEPVASLSFSRHHELYSVAPLMAHTQTGERVAPVIGFVRCGKACLLDVRALYIDWALGNFANEALFHPPQCQGSAHERVAEQAARSHPFSQAFFPAMFGYCAACLNLPGAASVGSGEGDAPAF